MGVQPRQRTSRPGGSSSLRSCCPPRRDDQVGHGRAYWSSLGSIGVPPVRKRHFQPTHRPEDDAPRFRLCQYPVGSASASLLATVCRWHSIRRRAGEAVRGSRPCSIRRGRCVGRRCSRARRRSSNGDDMMAICERVWASGAPPILARVPVALLRNLVSRAARRGQVRCARPSARLARLGVTGLEPVNVTASSDKGLPIPASDGAAESGACAAPDGFSGAESGVADDPDLTHLITAWPTLTADAQARILAIVNEPRRTP